VAPTLWGPLERASLASKCITPSSKPFRIDLQTYFSAYEDETNGNTLNNFGFSGNPFQARNLTEICRIGEISVLTASSIKMAVF
jgi:hypothetical protein